MSIIDFILIALVLSCFVILFKEIRTARREAKVLRVKDYPFKDMFKNFSKIQDEINACKNKEELRDAYLSIFAFEALYSDSSSFTSELYEMYTIKQQDLLRETQAVPTH